MIHFEFHNFYCSECDIRHSEQPSEQAKQSCLDKFFIEAWLRLIEHEEKPVQGLTEEEDMLPSEIEGLVQSAQLLFLTSL